MLGLIIGGAVLFSIFGAIARIAMDPVGAGVGIIRFGAFCFAAMCWLAYAVIDGAEQGTALLYASIGTTVWILTFFLRH